MYLCEIFSHFCMFHFSLFPLGIGKQSRSLFLELDANSAAVKTPIQSSPSMTNVGNQPRQTPRQLSQVKCDANMSLKFLI